MVKYLSNINLFVVVFLFLSFFGCIENSKRVENDKANIGNTVSSLQGNWFEIIDQSKNEYNELYVDSSKFYFYIGILGAIQPWSYSLEGDSLISFYYETGDTIFRQIRLDLNSKSNLLVIHYNDSTIKSYKKINCEERCLSDYIMRNISKDKYVDAFFDRKQTLSK